MLTRLGDDDDALWTCQDCSRGDPASLRLKLLRNICCVFDHLIANSPLHLFKTAYVAVLMQIVKISPRRPQRVQHAHRRLAFLPGREGAARSSPWNG